MKKKKEHPKHELKLFHQHKDTVRVSVNINQISTPTPEKYIKDPLLDFLWQTSIQTNIQFLSKPTNYQPKEHRPVTLFSQKNLTNKQRLICYPH